MSQKLGQALNGLQSTVDRRKGLYSFAVEMSRIANKKSADAKAERKADGRVYNMALAMVNISNRVKN